MMQTPFDGLPDPQQLSRLATAMYRGLDIDSSLPPPLAEELSAPTEARNTPHGASDVTQLRESSFVNLRTPPTAAHPDVDSFAIGPTQLHRYYFLPESPATGNPPTPAAVFRPEAVRADFPALHQRVHGKPLVWLDNAATSQKPQAVIDAVSSYYKHDNSNVHRGAHELAARATDAYEGSRQTVQRFIGARSPREIVFVRGTTEGINLVSQTYGRQHLGPGDEIVLTELEHHANIVPWQLLARERGAILRVVPITDSGEVVLDEYSRLLGPRTKLVAFSQASNVLGTLLPARQMTAMAHAVGARVLLDGAQAVPHGRVNVQDLDCDFFVFSGHKLFGPTGIGVLFGKRDLLEDMPPWQAGGSMIKSVTFQETTFADVPQKFEAGTPNIGGAVGLKAAIDYVEHIGFDAATRHERALTDFGMEALRTLPRVRLIGTAPDKVGVLSFVLDGVPPEDVGRFLDREGIAVRAGHHCAQPTMRRFNVPGTVRPSLALYNTHEDLERLVTAVYKATRALT